MWFWGIMVACLLLSSWWLIQNNLLFHSDVGRDMYLLKDIVDNRHLTLIGPRSSLSGFFHGPLWLYISLPVFLIGAGNPVVMAIFWLILLILSWWLVYQTGRRMTDETTAMVATVLVGSATILNSHATINSYGAVIIFPLFYYCFGEYIRTKKTKYLGLGLLVGGAMVQFEIVFGLPMLSVLIIYSVFEIFRSRKWRNMWIYMLLLVPFSTYLIFDLRHEWIQTKAVLGMSGDFSAFNWPDMINWWKLMTGNKILAWFAVIGVIWVSLIKFKNRNNEYDSWWLWGGTVVVLWGVLMVMKIESVDFYYLPLISAMAMMIACLKNYFNKRLYWVLIVSIVSVNLIRAVKDTVNYSRDVNRQDQATWLANVEAGNWVVDHCGNNFGYFVYSSDLYGYSLRYMMDHLKIKEDVIGDLNVKKEITCLLMGPNSIENNWSRETWRESDVKIKTKPAELKLFGNGILVEKYILSAEEQKIAPNPFLIKDAAFR